MHPVLSISPIAQLAKQADPFSYVFLHGLNGDPERTWTHENGFYWPSRIAKDVPGSRVMVYGYNADFERALVKNETTIDAIAEGFVGQLIVKRQGDMVGFCHPCGQLVRNRVS